MMCNYVNGCQLLETPGFLDVAPFAQEILLINESNWLGFEESQAAKTLRIDGFESSDNVKLSQLLEAAVIIARGRKLDKIRFADTLSLEKLVVFLDFGFFGHKGAGADENIYLTLRL